jgi:signal transduction histidine kinase/ligand-binding sensor domain-containing protein
MTTMKFTIRQCGLFSWAVATCLFSALMCRPASALDPNRKISQYGHTAWRIQDGVFSGAPHAITQTTDGYLWIGTESGLLRFDGIRFVPWTPPEGKSLPSSAIYSLLGVGDGSLWIGTGRGLAHWTNGDLVTYATAKGRVNSVLEDHQGRIWLARSRLGDQAGPLCEITGAKIRCYGVDDGVNCSAGGPLAVDKQENIWLGGAEGMCRWKTGSANIYLQKETQQTEGLNGVAGLAAADDGTLWVGISRPGKALGLRQFVDGVSKSYGLPGMDGRSLAASTLFLDRNNTLWVGTIGQGIYHVYKGRADHFRSADGLSSDTIENFYQDREGNLWVVTSKGIDCFHDIRVASISVTEGLTADHVDSVLAAHDGTVWIGNHGALDLIRQGAVSRITAREGMPGLRVTSLFEDDAGRLWVGVDVGLAVYEHQRFQLIRRPDGSSLGPVISITEDTDHDIWAETIGSQPSLFRIRDRQVREVIPAPQIPRASRLAADPHGGIWLGLRDGELARYRNGSFERFSISQQPEMEPIRDLRLDSDSAVLAATSVGLFRWRDGKGNLLSSRNGLPCDSINASIRDNSGSLWLSTRCGYVGIADSELEKWWKQPDSIVKVRTLDAFDGAQPAAVPFSPGASKSADGRLWFANESIVQVIDPGYLSVNAIPPPVHIEQIIADRKQYSFRKHLRLPAHTRDLEIDYTALSFVAPQKVRFRYKLEGRDSEWQEPQTRRQAFYSDLPPGKYSFHVVASNNDGVWNEAGATIDFDILPAFYQTNWFLALCALAAIALLYLFYLSRLSLATQQVRASMEARLAERERIARDLHDTLLQSVQGLILKFHAVAKQIPSEEPARETLEKTLDHADIVLAEGRDRVRNLRAAAVSLSDLPAAFQQVADEMPQGHQATFKTLVEGSVRELHPMVVEECFAIGREALINALNHSEGLNIEVEIAYDPRQFRLRVRDDGRGIDPGILEKGGRDGHWGLPGMRERATKIGAQLKLWSRPGSGTEVEVRVPGGTAYRAPRAELRSA